MRQTNEAGKDLGFLVINDYAGFEAKTVKAGIVLDAVHKQPCSRQARQKLATSILRDLGLYPQND